MEMPEKPLPSGDAPHFRKRLLGGEEAGFAGNAVALGAEPLGPVGRLCGGGQE